MALVHGVAGAPSRLQATLEIASVVAKVKFALVCVVGFDGSDAGAMVTPIAAGSSWTAETVPVIGGAPGAGGNGG